MKPIFNDKEVVVSANGPLKDACRSVSAIAKAMPEQMEKYNIEVQLATKAYQEK